MINYIGYEGLTPEQIKEKVLIEFYKTGKVNGIYMKKASTSKENPLKFYIKGWLSLNRLKDYQDQFVEDFYQMTFFELWRYPAQKFCDNFFNKKLQLNINKLCATACLIIKLKGFYHLPTGNPNHSLITKLMHTSAFSDGNVAVSILEANDDESIIIEDTESQHQTDIVDGLSADERELFYSMINKKFNPDRLTTDQVQLLNKLKHLNNDRRRFI